ncbi:ChaN family lipoprotein [Williamwhitmania taraxaci]|uniref:Uncharacterized iron-regulated protein n=1 Tax=Williamwhitmania taraxaci TaxID=1640674 RepID=A0A1G6GS99_9BACT|nr:ChaN family lipoprotein [Williamwhitmania taraxaci]SDB84753.1 Uncharacterized iron-regulated protein [Williamwhitmania taraxaci]
MKKMVASLILSLLAIVIQAQEVVPYRIFNSKASIVSFEILAEQANNSDVVFFGELHNSAIAHWLELELAVSMQKRFSSNLVLGAEMFEADNQLLLDELLEKRIPIQKFEADGRFWPNYKTDYKPLVEFALANKLRFVATNIPRRYAAAVGKDGLFILNSFSADAKRYFAPLPILYDTSLSCYKSMQSMAMASGGHGPAYIVDAQAAKDATMAHFIMLNFPKEGAFLHFNGSYHSDNHEGIVDLVHRKMPKLKILVITTVEQDQLETLDDENEGHADFTIVVNSRITKTY